MYFGEKPGGLCCRKIDAASPRTPAMTYPRSPLVSLVDSTGRVIREDKRGYIPGETPQILERLNIDPEQFITTAARMLDLFRACEHWDIRFA